MIEEGCVEPSGRLHEITPGLLSDVLRRCGEARIRVAGTSMLPSIRPADILDIRPVDIARVQPEDVIVVARGRRLFAHRVVRVDRRDGQRVLITRGDMHAHDDPPVTAPQLLGRVEGQVRNGTFLSAGRAPARRARRRPGGVWFGCVCLVHRGAQVMRSLGRPRL